MISATALGSVTYPRRCTWCVQQYTYISSSFRRSNIFVLYVMCSSTPREFREDSSCIVDSGNVSLNISLGIHNLVLKRLCSCDTLRSLQFTDLGLLFP